MLIYCYYDNFCNRIMSEAKKAGHYDERYQNMIDEKGLKLFIYTSQEKHVINDEKDERN